jgi:hypothetical protein
MYAIRQDVAVDVWVGNLKKKNAATLRGLGSVCYGEGFENKALHPELRAASL